MSNKTLSRIALGLFAIAFAYYLYGISIGWDENLFSYHGTSRQSQTALTTYYMVHGPFKLDYETPFWGMPWSIPMEFPLYQGIVAMAVRVFDTPLVQTGRAVSAIFYLLTLIPCYFILGRLRVAPAHRFMILALLLVSPKYILLSRVFLIETCALFFGMAYLACALRAIETRSKWVIAWAILFGAAAALVKITTFLVYGILVGLLALRGRLLQPATHPFWRNMVLAFLMGVLPLVSGVAWTKYTDHIKTRNPIGESWTSTAPYSKRWHIGTLQQRFQPDVIYRIAGQTLSLIAPNRDSGMSGVFSKTTTWIGMAASLVIVMGCGFLFWKFPARRNLVLIGLGAYLLGALLSTNLWYHHSYYLAGVGVLFIMAVGLLVISPKPPVSLWICGCFMMGGIAGHQLFFRPIQESQEQRRVLEVVEGANPTVLFAPDLIRENTEPDAISIASDFDIALAYYSQRRMLLIDKYAFQDEKLRRERFREALFRLKDQKIGIILIKEVPGEPHEWLLQALRENGLPMERVRFFTCPPKNQ